MGNRFNRCKHWLLIATITGATNLGGIAHAQQNAAVLTQQPKSTTDQVLDELDKDSVVATPVETTASTVAEVAPANTARIRAGDTLYISFTEETTESTESSSLLPGVNIYTIDAKGYLTLDGIGSFKVAGLSPEETVLRLGAEPMLQNIAISVSLLPVEPDAATTLPVFGLNMFENAIEESATNIPVPEDYIIGPGDEIIVQLYGTESISETLTVSREGVIDFPKIGPVSVAGNSFADLKEMLAAKVENQLIGAKLYLTLGELRSVNVYVVGEVNAPGNYVVSGLSTVVDVLKRSGGVNTIGSLRQIQIKRNGVVATTVDLYDLLLNGNMTSNMRIQAGDVILVPPLDNQATVSGDVKRPAIYEIGQSQSLAQVIALAGGLNASAFNGRVIIERFDQNHQRRLIEANLSTDTGRNFRVVDGDKIAVQSMDAEIDGSVKVFGHVLNEGAHGWRPGMTLSDVIPSLQAVKKKPDLHYVLVKRQEPGARYPLLLKADLEKALTRKKSADDIRLSPNDEVYVFGFAQPGQRQYLLTPVIESIKQQASLTRPAQVVAVEGGVFEPGEYPLTSGMRVSDLILASGRFKESASAYAAEITRIVVDENSDRTYQHIPVRLTDIEAGNPEADVQLQPYDTLVIKNDPRWTERHEVILTGEVRFPGTYPIARGEQLSSLIERAGGLTDVAFPQGVVFSRVTVKEAESAQALALADKLEVGMKATILERADENLRPTESLGVATDVINLLRNIEPIGRVVIDLPKILEETAVNRVSDADVMLMDGDAIYIPEYRQAVSVVGEVNHPTTLLYEEGQDLMAYIERSGGMTKKTKKELAYIVHADGSAAPKKRWWHAQDIKPGDTIVVPLDVEKIRTLKALSEVASIIGNLVTPTASVINAAASWKIAEDGQVLIQTLDNGTTGTTTP